MKNILLLISSFWSVGLCSLDSTAQTIKPDLQNLSQWPVFNRTVEAVNQDGKKAVRFSETEGEGYLILKDIDFTSGVIEFDVKGKDVVQQSFVGCVFHGQDEKRYDAIYFRPFNFTNPDTTKRQRAVQYIAMPDYPWEKLREAFPGKYENVVDPVPDPDSWFHVKIVVDGKQVSAYVNHSQRPSLQVEKLNNSSNGGIALWVGNNSGGSFANLVITPSTSATVASTVQKTVTYGDNPQAGAYYNVGDANIYYEVYGKGKPLVLLHGGVYGYISEFQNLIPKLSENYQVICIATRGHGRSEIGKEPFTYKQRAEDAYKVIRSITSDSAVVIGFSDGGYSALKLAALYPQLVKKVVAMGISDHPKNASSQKFHYSAASLLKSDSVFFSGRLKLMPEPIRWNETLLKLNTLYNDDFMSTETFGKIKCPALIMTGDRDEYHTVTGAATCAKSIRNAQLAVIPGCGHVIFFCNFPAMWESLVPFLKK